jgi:hypothetical protein
MHKSKPIQQLFSDTAPEAEAVLIDLLRRKSAAEKFAMVNQLNESLRVMMLSGLHQRYPNASELEIKQRFAQLLLGEELGQEFWLAYKERLEGHERTV